MGVLISNQQNRSDLPIPEIERMAQRLLDALGSPDGEISILMVDDPRMAGYNQTYLNRKGATNVLSFPMQEGPFSGINPQMLGDVVISVDTARREAEEMGIPFMDRMLELLIHGTLHLFGYDHDQSPEAYDRMERKSEALFRELTRTSHR